MLLLNYSHPLTPEQKEAIEALTQQPISRLVEQTVQFEVNQPFVPQVVAVLDHVGLTAAEWQQVPLMVILPALNFAAAVMLAELHGRMGYFPPMVRLRPIKGAVPPQFEVAEIINLNEVRDAARGKR